MLGQYLSRSRLWKNVLMLLPELTEKKVPKKSLLQIIPSDSPASIKTSSILQQTADNSASLFLTNPHWNLPEPQNTPAAAMGSIGAQTDKVRPTTLKEFETVFPKLVDDLSEACRGYGLPDNALKWFQEVCAPFFKHSIAPPPPLLAKPP